MPPPLENLKSRNAARVPQTQTVLSPADSDSPSPADKPEIHPVEDLCSRPSDTRDIRARFSTAVDQGPVDRTAVDMPHPVEDLGLRPSRAVDLGLRPSSAAATALVSSPLSRPPLSRLPLSRPPLSRLTLRGFAPPRCRNSRRTPPLSRPPDVATAAGPLRTRV